MTMRMRLLTITLLGLSLGACAGAPPKPAPFSTTAEPATTEQPEVLPPAERQQTMEKICAQPGYGCVMESFDISLIKRDGSRYHMTMDAPTPIVQADTINVYAGQTLYVEADVKGDALTNLHLVKSVTHPERTLSFSFTQPAGVGDGKAMILVVHNPFDRPLRYHAAMMYLDDPKSDLYKTDTCPVMAKLQGSEGWPMPLFMLYLEDLELLQPGADMSCKD